jgi:hypothetical protein
MKIEEYKKMIKKNEDENIYLLYTEDKMKNEFSELFKMLPEKQNLKRKRDTSYIENTDNNKKIKIN